MDDKSRDSFDTAPRSGREATGWDSQTPVAYNPLVVHCTPELAPLYVRKRIFADMTAPLSTELLLRVLTARGFCLGRLSSLEVLGASNRFVDIFSCLRWCVCSAVVI